MQQSDELDAPVTRIESYTRRRKTERRFSPDPAFLTRTHEDILPMALDIAIGKTPYVRPIAATASVMHWGWATDNKRFLGGQQ